MNKCLRSSGYWLLSKQPSLWSLFWRYRHFITGKDFAINTELPSRKYLLDIVSKNEFKTLLEIGCGSASNLIVLAQKFPDRMFYGIDINAQAIECGQAETDRLGIKNILLLNIDMIKFFDIGYKFDVILSAAVLMYIAPNKIKAVLNKLHSMGKVLVLMEFNSNSGEKSILHEGSWLHDYRELLPNCAMIRFEQHHWKSEKWLEFGRIIINEKRTHNS